MTMMNCQDALNHCQAYLDQQLENPVAKTVNEHLAVCQCCADRFAAERSFHSLLKSKVHASCQNAAPASLCHRLSDLLQHCPLAASTRRATARLQRQPIALPTRRLRGTVGIAASFMFGLSGLFMFQSACIHRQCPLVQAAQREHDNIVAGERPMMVRSSNTAVLNQFASQQLPNLSSIPSLANCKLMPQATGVCQIDGLPKGIFVQYMHCHCNNEAVTLMIINTSNEPSGTLIKEKFIAAQNAEHNILSWHQSKDLLYIVVTKLPFDDALQVAEAVGR